MDGLDQVFSKSQEQHINLLKILSIHKSGPSFVALKIQPYETE